MWLPTTLAHPAEGLLTIVMIIVLMMDKMMMTRMMALVPMICQQGRIGGTSSIARPTIHGLTRQEIH